jgi:actin-like ATPase involved in cell morphogenesis
MPQLTTSKGGSVSYILGVDLGTTFTAAAIAEGGQLEVFQLGTRTASIPSVVAVREGGEVLVGEAAERRALQEPNRVAREFKRRLGDPTPLTLGGTPYSAESLTAMLLRAVVAQVERERGEAPERLVITHPASYGAYKLDLLRLAVDEARVGPATFVSEPQAAAAYYARRERIDVGAAVAVYDFGGGTFDAAVVRRTADGFDLLGTPTGLDRLGGIDIDQAVFAHVDESVGGRISALDADDTSVLNAVADLRASGRDAKEALSADTDTVVGIALPDLHTDVRLTRAELETMIRPRLADTLDALEQTVRSAGLEFADLDRVLLVGGSAQIPLVAELVASRTGRPIAVDANPKHSISLGAAAIGAGDVDVPAATPAVAVPEARETPVAPMPASPSSHKNRVPVFIGVGALVVVVIIAAVLLLGGGSDKKAASSAGSSSSASSGTVAEASTRGYSTTIHYAGLAITLSKIEVKPQPDKTQIDATVVVKNEGATDGSLQSGGVGLQVDGNDVVGDASAIPNLASGSQQSGVVIFFLDPGVNFNFDTSLLQFGKATEARAVIPLGADHTGLVDHAPQVTTLDGEISAVPDTLTLEKAVVSASSNINQQALARKVFIEIDVNGTSTSEFGANSIDVTLTTPGGEQVAATVLGSEQTPACCFNGFPHNGSGKAFFYFEVAENFVGKYSLQYTRDGASVGKVDFTLNAVG